MDIVLNVQAANGSLPTVEYRWDEDTDILTAHLGHGALAGEGMTGSVELAGTDGSWLILDVKAGRIEGIEVVVWPEVRKVGTLTAPAGEDAAVHVAARQSHDKVQLMQVDTPIGAEADRAEHTIHFALGKRRAGRSLRIASDIVLDVDERSGLSGIWLLNVPPFPGHE